MLHSRGERGEVIANHFKLPIMLSSAAAAELIASAALCPLEVLKLRMQTSTALSNMGLRRAMLHITQQEGLSALFKGFAPIALRQVPYTACKLVSFEIGVNCMHRAVQRRAIARSCDPLARSNGEEASQSAARALEDNRMTIVLMAGLAAGAAAATVSQPFDLLLTRICGAADVTNLASCVIAEGLGQQIKYLISLGPSAFTGLAPRLAMISLMTSCQFLVYDNIRLALRCPATIEAK